MFRGLAIASTMQAIIVDRVAIVKPQLAAFIKDNADPMRATPEDSQAACPTDSKVMTSGNTRPSTTCIAVVHIKLPSSQVLSAIVQVLATAALPKKGNLLEKTMRVSGARGTKMFRALPIAPTVQVIIVDRVAVVKPQVSAIVKDNADPKMTIPVESQAACQTHSKVTTSDNNKQSASCIAVFLFKLPSSHLRSTVEPSEC